MAKIEFNGLYIKLEFRCKDKDECISTETYEDIKWISKEEIKKAHKAIQVFIHEYVSKDKLKDIYDSQINRDRLDTDT